MKNIITKRQKELLGIIYQYIKDSGFPPTFEEMRESLGVSSNQSIIDLLEKLKNKGFIKKSESSARGITILPAGYEVLGNPPLAPFLGATAAGAPLEIIETIGEWQSLSGEVAQFSGEIFLLKIQGESMINVGINDGDIVLVRKQDEFISGDIVLAQTSEGSTVKRFISQDKPPYIYLKPENPNPQYKNILFTDETRLIGKVLSVLNKNNWRAVK